MVALPTEPARCAPFFKIFFFINGTWKFREARLLVELIEGRGSMCVQAVMLRNPAQPLWTYSDRMSSGKLLGPDSDMLIWS